MAQIAAVAVDKATPQFDREYSYLVPDGLPVQVGCRVTVPFGRGNRRRLGLVLSLSQSEDTARLILHRLIDPAFGQKPHRRAKGPQKSPCVEMHGLRVLRLQHARPE